ncbi:hypothetical protein [Cellulosimicrobium sp. Marseille-Q8652]
MTHEHERAAPTPAADPWRTWAPGTRVVVRRRLGAAEVTPDGKTLTDVIGVVVSSDDTALTLHEDAGGGAPPHRGHGPADAGPPVVVVPLSEIVAGKVVPPRPPRRPA